MFVIGPVPAPEEALPAGPAEDAPPAAPLDEPAPEEALPPQAASKASKTTVPLAAARQRGQPGLALRPGLCSLGPGPRRHWI
jgi:hypothetical protein